MAEDSLANLIKRRGIAKRSLTNIENCLCREDLKPHELSVRQDTLSAIWQEFKLSQDLIEINAEIPGQHFIEKGFENNFILCHLRLVRCLVSPPGVCHMSLKDNRILIVPGWNFPPLTFRGRAAPIVARALSTVSRPFLPRTAGDRLHSFKNM